VAIEIIFVFADTSHPEACPATIPLTGKRGVDEGYTIKTALDQEARLASWAGSVINALDIIALANVTHC
jgi:hypothetical protein